MPNTEFPKSISEYVDYRDFLCQRFAIEKEKKKSFSFQYCGNQLGTSKVYLKLLLEKKRHTTLSKVPALAKLFRLNSFEQQYLTVMVLKGTTESSELKSYFGDVLLKMQNSNYYQTDDFKKTAPGSDSRIFQSWLKMAIHALARNGDFKPDADWIQNHLLGDIDKNEVEAALESLIETSSLIEVDGQLKPSEFTFGTVNTFDLEGFKIYRVGLSRMHEILENVTTHKPCSFHMMALSIADEDHVELFRLFNEFRDKLISLSKKSEGGKRTGFLISNNIAALTE